jgi:ADP-heptose:LPS heptosyltransferase
MTRAQGERAALPTREVAFDCRYFLGDRPCLPHKQEGAVCTCSHYRPVREQVLIIKLDAMGDVLRTTTLLPALALAHPEAAITWITRPESTPLLRNNPQLTNVVAYGADALVCLGARTFDRVINLDSGQVSTGLATLARAPRKDGFILNEQGQVQATNPAARAWLEMGLFDDLKRQNTRTYQSIMFEILGLPRQGEGYVFELTAEEQRAGRKHLTRLGIDADRPLVGLNTGAGGRWELKRWRMAGFQELIQRLHEEQGVQVLLMGGPAEAERNARLRAAAPVPVFDTGGDNEVRHFAALTRCCDVVVTGDTLAMHLALAVKSRAVVLFGPTSASEIELYGLGEKVVPHMTCLSCYKSTCDFVPNCMDLISTDMVAAAVARQLRFGVHKREAAHAAR